MTGRNKIISYSLFGATTITEKWLFYTYMRGLYFNVIMNKQIYPEFTTHVEIDNKTFSEYNHFFDWLTTHYGMTYSVNPIEPRCKAMLWRLKPVFNGADVVLCRDADAITTWRERTAVNEWLQSSKPVHAILDNPAHSGVMGGMCGFRKINWPQTIDELIDNRELSTHGTDQDLLNEKINPEDIHYTNMTKRYSTMENNLWESDLCCRHIGSAGIVEMETIRFFRRRGLEQVGDFAKRYPEIFNWI